MIKFLIAVLVFLGLSFIGLMWFVAVMAKVTLWVPAGLTAMIMVGLAVFWVVRALLARHAADGLERGLSRQANEQVRLTRPDMQPEALRLQRDFEAGLEALKASRLGRSSHNALYALPWYAIIGPPGAGKTTALRQSGLQFPAIKGRAEASAIKGLGGTRNCDWWLTNEAVLLDTAGRWATQPEDHAEWLSFLGLLKRYRSRKPLNGLIAAVSIGDVVNGSQADVDALAARMRERIDEVMAELRMTMPVYVLFTKCDLIDGFVETFGSLSRSERNQVWGFTKPFTGKSEKISTLLEQELNAIAAGLDRRARASMLDELNLAARQRIYAFPQQFAMMRSRLSRFVNALFEENTYEDALALRGVYFSSGTQEGRRFSLLMNRLASSVGLEVPPAETAPQLVRKTYFLHDLFEGVIFPDRNIASASEVELRRRQRIRWALTGTLALLALLVGVGPSYSWYRNRTLLSDVRHVLSRWESKSDTAPITAQSAGVLRGLYPLRDLIETLQGYASNGPPLSMSLGMYTGTDLLPQLSKYYASLVRRGLVTPTLAKESQQITDFGYRYEVLPHAKPSSSEQDQIYDLLKLHLLLTEPTQNDEPPFAEYADWVAERLAASWTTSESDPGIVKAAVANARLYTSCIGDMPELKFQRDTAIVGRARSALSRVPPYERALQHLTAVVSDEGLDVTLASLVGRVSSMRSDGRVRGAFTRQGWDTKVRDMLSRELLKYAGELWVLGRAGPDDDRAEQIAAQLHELCSAYFHAYIQEWQEFLATIRTARPGGSEESLAELQELTRGQPPPIALLLQRVQYNVKLPTSAGKDDSQANTGVLATIRGRLQELLHATGAVTISCPDEPEQRSLEAGSGNKLYTAKNVADAFKDLTAFAVPPQTNEGPPPVVAYDTYHGQLCSVRDALLGQADDQQLASELLTRLQTARTRIRSLIDEQKEPVRPFFNAALWPPIDGAAISSIRNGANVTQKSWCSSVYAPFRARMASTYPFNRAGQDVALSDFADFYKPGGIVTRFVGESLAGVAQESGGRYSFTTRLGRDASSVYAHDLLDFLDRSYDIGRSFFADGAGPQMRFQIRIHPSPGVAVTTLRVGGQEVQYHNGPETWETLIWPGPEPDAGAVLEARGANGMSVRLPQSGPWGLFRLLEEGSIAAQSPRSLAVEWELKSHDVTIRADVRAARGASPLFGVERAGGGGTFLQPVRAKGVSAPGTIALNGRACSAQP